MNAKPPAAPRPARLCLSAVRCRCTRRTDVSVCGFVCNRYEVGTYDVRRASVHISNGSPTQTHWFGRARARIYLKCDGIRLHRSPPLFSSSIVRVLSAAAAAAATYEFRAHIFPSPSTNSIPFGTRDAKRSSSSHFSLFRSQSARNIETFSWVHIRGTCTFLAIDFFCSPRAHLLVSFCFFILLFVLM